jgi:Uma2 family endonuclease
MAHTPTQSLSFEDYLNYSDDTDNRYELTHGALIPLPPESGENLEIAFFLALKFAEWVGHKRVRIQNTELQVRGNPANRWPDILILTEAHVPQLKRRSTLFLEMEPPLLVVEVVSPGRENRERDYLEKLLQYQDREIPEYWIIDPEEEKVTIFNLDEAGRYRQREPFRGEALVESQILPKLRLTAAAILESGA